MDEIARGYAFVVHGAGLLNLRLGLASRKKYERAWYEVTRMSVKGRFRGDYSNNDYFRMGAAVAVGELYDMAAFGRFLKSDCEVRAYLESFGVHGMDDVNNLGIRGPYRRSFERLFLGGAAAD